MEITKFSKIVKDNNKNDLLHFVIRGQLGRLSNFSLYLKLENKSMKDKVAIDTYTQENGEISFDYVLLSKHTSENILSVQVQLEDDNGLVAQSEIQELELEKTIKVDEEISEKYPTILLQLEAKVSSFDSRLEHLEETALTESDVIDDVSSEATNKPLSANQGKVLNEKINSAISGVMHYKGSVQTYDDLPTEDVEIGDLYNVIDDDTNYAWAGSEWDMVGSSVDLSNYTTKVEIPQFQATATIVGNALTNINGKVLTTFEATLHDIGVSYIHYEITKNGNKCTYEEALDYISRMSGTKYVPTYNYDYPRNSLWVFADGTIWKPQYDDVNGLLLYKVGGGVAMKSELSSYVDLSSAQIITGIKTIQDTEIQVKNTEASGNAVWSIEEDKYAQFVISRYYNGNKATMFRLNGSNILPPANSTLGNSNNRWQDLYISGFINSNGNIGLRPNNVNYDLFAIKTTEILTWKGIRPATNDLDLGTSGSKWKDLYLSGVLTDGTNSVSIADLKALIDYAKSQGWIS